MTVIAKQGDKNSTVAEMQKLLSLLGYDLIVDGDFGPRSSRSLKAFQKSQNLNQTGVLDDISLQALKAAQKRSAKEIQDGSEKNYGSLEIVKNRLTSSQYTKQIFPKTQIFIHFTAGNGSAESTINWFEADTGTVATAFVIGRTDGKTHEAFNPDFWGFHLGIKGTNGALDKISIGIEICSWGPLTENNGKHYRYTDYDKKTKKNLWLDKNIVPVSEVYTLPTEFRGYKHFEKYTDAQLDSLENLLKFLVKEYGISVQSSFDDSWFEYNEQVITDKLPGIWTHVNVRKDKTDSYPDHRLLELLNRISNWSKIL